MYPTSLLVSVCLLYGLSASHFCSCLYDIYNPCAPASCGNGVSISYPFYLDGLERSNCGVPGFNMSCNQTSGVVGITIGSRTLSVLEINYSTQSLRVYDNDFLRIGETCTIPDKNLTVMGIRFAYVGIPRWVVLYSGCIKSVTSNLTLYSSLKCQDILAMLSNDSLAVYASKVCQRAVRMPVEVYYGELTLNREENTTQEAGAYWEQYKTVLRRGIELKWIAPICSNCINSGGRCGFDEVDYRTVCYCRDRAHMNSCPRERPGLSRYKVISIGASAAVVTLTIIVALLLIQKKRRKNPKNIIDFLRKNESLTPKRYKYSEVKKMTQSFKHKLGHGGFGSVYKGKLEDGRLVAVKVLSSAKSSDGDDFINEVASISRTSHVNIVSLIGFCISGSKRALIYEFMPNGSLEKFIYEEKLSEPKRKLSWDKLHSIAVGIAQGLEYLHRGCNTRILHLDIKPHNILLDEDFCPKISDFGLAKICKNKESAVSMLGARGTIGFIAPEHVCRNLGRVSHKSDVYSYGMMILEMVGGRKNVDAIADKSSEIYFPHWIYKRIQSNQELELDGLTNADSKATARKMIIVGLWCIQTDPANRLPISQVIDMLQGNGDLLTVPPKPYMYSPSSSPQHSSAIRSSSTLG